MSQKNLPLRLSSFYLFAYAYTGIYRPFFTLWLKEEKNFTLDQIGFLLSGIGLIRLVYDPLIGHVADKTGDHKRLLISITFLSASLLITMYFFNSVIVITTLFILFYGFRWQMFTLAEQLTASSLQSFPVSLRYTKTFLTIILVAIILFLWHSPLNFLIKCIALFFCIIVYIWQFSRSQDENILLAYSHIRLWGSLSFVLVLPILYLLQKYFSPNDLYKNVVPLMALLVFLTAIITCFMPRSSIKNTKQHGSQSNTQLPFFPLKVLWKKYRSALVFIILIGLLKSTTAMYNSFGSLIWNEQGFSSTAIGSIYAFESLANLFFFFAAARLVYKIHPVLIFILCSLIMTLRWGFTPLLEQSNVALMLLHGLGGITYAVAHGTTMSFIYRLLPLNISTSSQALYGTLSYGLGSIYPPILSSLIQSNSNYGWWLMASISFFTLVCLIILWPFSRHWNQNLNL